MAYTRTKHQQHQRHLRHHQQQQQIFVPAAFGIVENGVYRSNTLYPINFTFIKRLNLKTVVQLSPEVPFKIVSAFFDENNIKFVRPFFSPPPSMAAKYWILCFVVFWKIHLGLKAWRTDATWKPMTEELIKEALEIILDVTTHPVLILCTSGVHQTGTLVGCLRKLQYWNITSILQEFRSYGNTRFVNEQFVELFDTDLVTLPQNLPDWFIQQQQMMEEETEEEIGKIQMVYRIKLEKQN